MCAILDRNKFGEFIHKTEEGGHFRKWLDAEGGCIVYPVDDQSGEVPTEFAGYVRALVQEYSDSRKLGRALLDYRARGKMRRFPASGIAPHLPALKRVRSDDRHILALALASGARLLYTADKQLAKDFQNPDIIGNPAGKVYMSAAHRDRLRPDICKTC